MRVPRGEAARFAHFIEVNHAATCIDPEKDEKLLKCAAAYARVGYYSPAFDPTRRAAFMRECNETWSAATRYFFLTEPFPSDLLVRLKSHVDTYFRYRERMADRDFNNTPVADIVEAAKQQMRDVVGLWQVYERYVLERRMPAAQQNRMYFDLFYPFFQAIVNVDEMDRPRLAPRVSQLIATAPAVGTVVSSSFGSWAPPLLSQTPQPPHGYTPYGHTLAQPAPNLSGAAHFSGQVLGAGGRATGHRGPPHLGTGNVGFVGKPISPSIVGSALGIPLPGVAACPHCPGNPSHCSFECPIRYFKKTGQPCPGFDQSGNRVQAAWNGVNITSQAKAAWRAYIAQYNLQDAHRAGGHAVNLN